MQKKKPHFKNSPIPVSILWTSLYEYSKKTPLLKHEHDEAQIIYILEGRGTLFNKDQSTTFTKGDFFLFLPREVHGLTVDGPKRVRTLEIKFRIHSELSKKLKAFSSRFKTTPDLEQLLFRLRAMAEEKGAYHLELCNAFIWEFLLLRMRGELGRAPQIQVTSTPLQRPDKICTLLMSLIEKHLTESTKPEMFEKATGLSYRQLSRRFQKQVGLTPIDYIKKRRVLLAQNLLRHTSLSCEAIGRQIGFETASHFNRVFRLQVGKSPALWRRRELAGVKKEIFLDHQFAHASRLVS